MRWDRTTFAELESLVKFGPQRDAAELPRKSFVIGCGLLIF